MPLEKQRLFLPAWVLFTKDYEYLPPSLLQYKKSY